MNELKPFDAVKTKKPEFPESYTIKQKLYSPLQALHYNLTFEFDDDYPAKMPRDFARDMITLYSDPGDVVWDGCCGSGIVPRLASRMGRTGIGSDVNPKAVKLSQEHDIANAANYRTMDGRSEIPNDFRNWEEPDLILSSLPFGLNICGDKNSYSHEKGDISNSPDYDTFYAGSKAIIRSYHAKLKPNGVCILDARDRLHKGKTVALILDFLRQAQEIGFELVTRYYYELIPYRQLTYRHRPTGHIRAMPETMDVIVLTKLEDQKLA